MSFIDPRTVIFLTGLMSGLMALVLWSIRQTYPPNIRGLSAWSLALSVLFIAGVISTAREALPAWLGIAVPNLLLWVGGYIAYVGTQRFFGVGSNIRVWAVLILIAFAPSLWYTVVEPDYPMRLRVFNAMMLAIMVAYAVLLYRQGMDSLAKAMAFSMIVGIGAIQVMRFVTTYTDPVTSMTDKSPQQLIFVCTFAFAILLISISMVLMATDKLRSELEHLATHDPLTNALTRRHVNQSIDLELQRCKRNGRSLALLVLDLDNFKQVNDSFGHPAGDQVLIKFVKDVNALLRQGDQLGRFGGEEFVVVLPDTTLEAASLVAERIRTVVAAPGSLLSSAPGFAPFCTVSIGVTTNSLVTDSVSSMLARADAAMYSAKANGRNRVEIL